MVIFLTSLRKYVMAVVVYGMVISFTSLHQIVVIWVKFGIWFWLLKCNTCFGCMENRHINTCEPNETDHLSMIWTKKILILWDPHYGPLDHSIELDYVMQYGHICLSSWS